MGELQRIECLRSLREIAVPLAERPARGDLTGEVCHWADGYHLNVRLYEKLLLSVFDVLDEGKLTEVSIFNSIHIVLYIYSTNVMKSTSLEVHTIFSIERVAGFIVVYDDGP